jgi:hypothetical protein
MGNAMALNDKDVDVGIAADWAAIQDKYALPEDDTPATDANADAGDTGDAGADPENSGRETNPVSRKPDRLFKAQGDKPSRDAAAADRGRTASAGAELAADADRDGSQPQGRDINRAPSTWKPTARASWEKLDPAIKAEIHRREADFQNGQAQILPDATLGKSMRQVIEPYRALIQAEGGTPESAVGNLFRTAAIFRTGTVQQKYQAIATVAQQYGIDLRYLAQAASEHLGQPPAQQQQPYAGQQQGEFRDPRVDQILAAQNQERLQAQAREQYQTESTVSRWMNEKDATGNPKRPYLGDVINEMSALVPQLRRADPSLTHAQALDAAYERATWAHPEVRQLLTQKQQADLNAQRRATNQTRVRDARRAGSVNVPRRGSTPSPGKPGTMDETIASTARELGLIS